MSSCNEIKMWPGRVRRALLAVCLPALLTPSAAAEVRVHDVSKIHGQRVNRLMGFGLVVGLDGTGDGGKYAATVRALSELHKRYAAPFFKLEEAQANTTVAIVTVEAMLPENGAHEGDRVDVVVAALGPAKSLKGGQLLVTPLQISPLGMAETAECLATAGGRIDFPETTNLKRGIIRGGATVEADLSYSFVDGDMLTLMINDAQANWPMAQMVARAINHEFSTPTGDGLADSQSTRVMVQSEIAEATSPNTVRVRVPRADQASPADFISRLMQTQLYALPEMPARIVINPITKAIISRGKIMLSPTTLNLGGMSITVGGETGAGVDSKDGAKAEAVDFDSLLAVMKKMQVPQAQIVQAVEQLVRSGLLHAQLDYQE